MNISELFPSKYIKGEDIGNKQFVLTIARVSLEEMGQEREQHPVVWFKEAKKGLVLKKSNALTIANLYGPETTSWTGKRITLYTEKMNAFGALQTVIKVRNQVPPPPKGEAVPAPEAPAPVKASLDEGKRQHLKAIANLSNQHDSFFMEESDITTLKELLLAEDSMDAEPMPTVPSPGKSTSMYHYLCQMIEQGVGVEGCAEPILTYLLGRVVSADTPPTMSVKGILLDDLMGDAQWSDAIIATYYHIKENVQLT